MGVDSSKNKSSWGGRREGSGRPKGSMNEASKERMAVKASFIERVNKNADKLFNSQLDLAIGEKYLMVKRVRGIGKDRKTWVEVVTDLDTIKAFIDDEVTLNEEAGEEYYYMTTKPANNQALDSLLNRSFGKAEEKLDVTSNGDTISSEPVNKSLVDAFIENLKNDTARGVNDGKETN